MRKNNPDPTLMKKWIVCWFTFLEGGEYSWLDWLFRLRALWKLLEVISKNSLEITYKSRPIDK